MPLTKKRVILASLETSYAQDAAPTGSTNAIEVSQLDITPLNSETIERNLVKPFLGGDLARLANHHVELSFSVTTAGSGTNRTPPAWGLLLKGCGFKQNIQTALVNYQPMSDEFPSLTFYVYQDGTLHKVMGARGTFSASLDANNYPSLSFTFRGLYKTPESASLPNADYSAFKMPPSLSKGSIASLRLFGQNVATASMNVDMGVTAPFISYLNEESVEITERNTTGQIEIKDPSLSPLNFFQKVENSDTGAFTLTIGKKSGEIIQWSAPKVQLLQPNYGDRDGIQTLTFDMRFLPQNGNDEITITTK